MTCKTIGEASPWASSCPSFAPVPAETRQLGKARSGERDRSTCISPHWRDRRVTRQPTATSCGCRCAAASTIRCAVL
jgi:hypothetical protein